MPTEDRSPEPAEYFQVHADLFALPPDDDTLESPDKFIERWSQWAAARLS